MLAMTMTMVTMAMTALTMMTMTMMMMIMMTMTHGVDLPERQRTTHLPATCHCLYFPATLQYLMYAFVVVSQSNQFTGNRIASQYKH